MFSAFSSTARRLSGPLFLTSLTTGTSVLIGDAFCQYMEFTQARTSIEENHRKSYGDNSKSPVDYSSIRSRTPLHPPRLPALPSSFTSLLPSWYNPTRALAMFATGFLFVSPYQFTVQRIAEHLIPGRAPMQVAKKILFNVGFAPGAISSTFYFTNYFQGGSHESGMQRIRLELFPTWQTGFLYWVPVHGLNLRFVELTYRPMVQAVAASGWGAFMSLQANRKLPAKKEEMAAEGKKEHKEETKDTTKTLLLAPQLTAQVSADRK